MNSRKPTKGKTTSRTVRYKQKLGKPAMAAESSSHDDLDAFRSDHGTLTSKGQTTIPKWIREKLGLKAGDALMFWVEDGRVVIRPRTGSVKDLKGILPPPSRSVSLKEMDEAIVAGALKRARR